MKIINDIINKRKKLMLELSDITAELFIKESILKNIEESAFEKFKNKIYLYGYIIKYLDFLNLNANEYKNDLNAIFKEKEISEVNNAEENIEDTLKSNKILIIGSICLIIIISSIIFIINNPDSTDKKTNDTEIKISTKIEETVSHNILIVSNDEIELKYRFNSDTFIEPVTLLSGDTHSIIFDSNLELSINNFFNASIYVDNKELSIEDLPDKENILLNFSKNENNEIIKRIVTESLK